MTRSVIVVCISCLFSFAALADDIGHPDDVPIVNAKDEAVYENIPRISKEYRGAPPEIEKEELRANCRAWVFETIERVGPDQVFDAWCTYKVDVILREYVYTGRVLIKNW